MNPRAPRRHGDIDRPQVRSRDSSNEAFVRSTNASTVLARERPDEIAHHLGVGVQPRANGSRSAARQRRRVSRSVVRVGPAWSDIDAKPTTWWRCPNARASQGEPHGRPRVRALGVSV